MTATTFTPFEDSHQSWCALSAPQYSEAERHAATRYVRRRHGDREDDARMVLTALGLIPDPLHKPPTSRDNHFKRQEASRG